MFAPRNGTVITALFVCALSMAGAIYLIVDLDKMPQNIKLQPRPPEIMQKVPKARIAVASILFSSFHLRRLF
jgi:hypothetical protein